MQLNNGKSKNFVLALYFAFAIAFVFAGLYLRFMRTLVGNDYLKIVLLFVVLAIVFFVINRIAKYFAYDSDGSVLSFINRGFLISEFINYRENRAEFPKRKLLYYRLKNYGLYKSLNLYIVSNEKHQKRLKFNVTLVKNKKLKYLKQSLDKVVKQNKESQIGNGK